MRYILFLLILLMFASPVFAQEAPQEQTQKRISDMLVNQGGMKEIKPLDLDEIGDRILEFGDSSFGFLQKGSLMFLVWGMGISVVILLFGIIVGKTAVLAGFAGIAISLLAFAIIQFMPETAGSLVQGIGKLFGQ
jgi:small-conductance mechanosensitive channel